MKFLFQLFINFQFIFFFGGGARWFIKTRFYNVNTLYYQQNIRHCLMLKCFRKKVTKMQFSYNGLKIALNWTSNHDNTK